MTPDLSLALTLFGYSRNQQLPVAGGTLDQGAACLAALSVCGAAWEAIEERDREQRAHG